MTKSPEKRSPAVPATTADYGTAAAAMQASQAGIRQAMASAETQVDAAMATVREAAGISAADAAMQASDAAQRSAEAAVRATEDIIARAGLAHPPAMSPGPARQPTEPAEPD